MAINEGPFERYRRAVKVKGKCLDKKTSYFIENHESTVTITVDRTEEQMPAVVVMTDADGADTSLVYVYDEEDIIKGDYFTWNDYQYFILEQVKIVKDVDFKKFKALECNVQINGEIGAYFAGNLKSFKNTKLESQTFEANSLSPVVIAPVNNALQINGYFTIKGQNWRIVDADLFSIDGIGFYYIERDLNARNYEEEYDTMEEEGLIENSNVIYVGQEITIPTENGFIQSDANITIVKRTKTKVVFKYSKTGSLVVKTLKNNEEISTKYEVKEV